MKLKFWKDSKPDKVTEVNKRLDRIKELKQKIWQLEMITSSTRVVASMNVFYGDRSKFKSTDVYITTDNSDFNAFWTKYKEDAAKLIEAYTIMIQNIENSIELDDSVTV